MPTYQGSPHPSHRASLRLPARSRQLVRAFIIIGISFTLAFVSVRTGHGISVNSGLLRFATVRQE